MAEAQHRFALYMRDLEYELRHHWGDPERARRYVDTLSGLADEMVKEELEGWYDHDF